jgi:hypothetical protein
VKTYSRRKHTDLIHDKNFSAPVFIVCRRLFLLHADLINGQLSKRASGPFAKYALTFCSVFRASVYRSANLFPFTRTFVFPPRKWGGAKDILASLQKVGGHGPFLVPRTAREDYSFSPLADLSLHERTTLLFQERTILSHAELCLPHVRAAPLGPGHFHSQGSRRIFSGQFRFACDPSLNKRSLFVPDLFSSYLS